MKRIKNCMTKSGFTLIEMIITIVVIVVLSSISVPIYKGYTRNAKMAEGYILLSSLCEAQKIYYSKYKMFLDFKQGSAGNDFSTANDEILGVNAIGNKYFTKFCVGYDNCGGSRSRLRYYVLIHATIPANLRRSPTDTELLLQYNITLGRKIVDSANEDLSWR